MFYAILKYLGYFQVFLSIYKYFQVFCGISDILLVFYGIFGYFEHLKVFRVFLDICNICYYYSWVFLGILGYVGFTFDFFVALLTIMGTFRVLGIINVLLATFVYYLESCACPMPSDGGQPQLDFPSGLNNTTHHLLKVFWYLLGLLGLFKIF